MSKTKISIIIPIYNAEDSIRECLDSLKKQSLKEIQAICVDDGSTDNTISILEEYAGQDERIVIVSQQNQGAGAARNSGLCKANGKYVAFLDADDFYLDEDALEKMYLLCERKSVAVCGSFRKHLEPYGFKDTHIIEHDQEYAKNEEILDYMDFQFDYEYQNFIFSRELLVNNNICFPNYRRYQDPPFLVRALYAAQKFVIADTYLYCYRVPNAVQRGGLYKTTEILSGIIDNLCFAAEHKLDILFNNTVRHIDYERRYLITYDLQANDIRIIDKLIEATKIIRDYYKKPNYVVNPLKDIINGYLDNQKNYENHIKQILNENDSIIVYGAGNLAKILFDYLVEIKLKQKVKYVMVSTEVSEHEIFQGVPLISIKDRKKCTSLKEFYVFIATTGTYHEKIMNSLKENGFCRFETVNDAFLFEYANMKSED